jgi:hypothetical protein
MLRLSLSTCMMPVSFQFVNPPLSRFGVSISTLAGNGTLFAVVAICEAAYFSTTYANFVESGSRRRAPAGSRSLRASVAGQGG